MMRTLLSLGLAIGLASLGPSLARAGDDNRQGDPTPENLLGAYRIVAGEMNGKTLASADLDGFKVRITPDIIAMADKDNNLFVIKFRLNTDAKPWKVAMTIAGDPQGRRGTHADGIMEIEQGGKVRLVYAVEGSPAPETFQTKEGVEQHMFVLQKVKGENGR